MIPRIFEGQTVAIVGSGPSMTGFDYSRLAGLPTVAINRRHEDLPDATVLWWTDAMYWRRARGTLKAHAAPYKATCRMHYVEVELQDLAAAQIHVYEMTGLRGFDPNPAFLRHGNNGGFAAMHLAAHLGAKTLVLFGLDMHTAPDGATHCDGGHGLAMHADHTFLNRMLPYFESLAEPLAERGIGVFNASPDSAIRCWPRVGREWGTDIMRGLP